jgi:hypothetical protein
VGVSAILSVTIFFWKPWGMAQMRQTARSVIERNLLGDLKHKICRFRQQLG